MKAARIPARGCLSSDQNGEHHRPYPEAQFDVQFDDLDAESWVIDEEGGSLKTTASLTVERAVILRWRIDCYSARPATCSWPLRSDAHLELGSTFISLDNM